jgi:hypothetical protein
MYPLCTKTAYQYSFMGSFLGTVLYQNRKYVRLIKAEIGRSKERKSYSQNVAKFIEWKSWQLNQFCPSVRKREKIAPMVPCSVCCGCAVSRRCCASPAINQQLTTASRVTIRDCHLWYSNHICVKPFRTRLQFAEPNSGLCLLCPPLLSIGSHVSSSCLHGMLSCIFAYKNVK